MGPHPASQLVSRARTRPRRARAAPARPPAARRPPPRPLARPPAHRRTPTHIGAACVRVAGAGRRAGQGPGLPVPGLRRLVRRRRLRRRRHYRRGTAAARTGGAWGRGARVAGPAAGAPRRPARARRRGACGAGGPARASGADRRRGAGGGVAGAGAGGGGRRRGVGRPSTLSAESRPGPGRPVRDSDSDPTARAAADGLSIGPMEGGAEPVAQPGPARPGPARPFPRPTGAVPDPKAHGRTASRGATGRDRTHVTLDDSEGCGSGGPGAVGPGDGGHQLPERSGALRLSESGPGPGVTPGLPVCRGGRTVAAGPQPAFQVISASVFMMRGSLGAEFFAGADGVRVVGPPVPTVCRPAGRPGLSSRACRDDRDLHDRAPGLCVIGAAVATRIGPMVILT
jgi:hypothetical protein